MGVSLKPVVVTAATISLTRNVHSNTVVLLDRAAGVTVTLPAATGTGDLYTVFVKTTVSSNSDKIQVANATDVMAGVLSVAADIAGVTCPTTSTSDTITMNGTTTGGIVGSLVYLQDVAVGIWSVNGALVASGTEATPFSAAVS